MRTGSPVSSIVGKRRQQLLEEHPALEPGEVHAEAEVLGDAERQVRVGRCGGCRSAAGRRTRPRRGWPTCSTSRPCRRPRSRRRAARCRRWPCAGSSAAGWPSAGSPRPRPATSAGSARSSASWSGWSSSARRPDESIVFVVSLPGGDELHEEAAEVDVGHVAAAEVGLEDQRREVVARRLLRAARAGELDRVHRHVDRAAATTSRRRSRGPGRWCSARPAGGCSGQSSAGRPMSWPITRDGSADVTSWTNSTSPCSRGRRHDLAADRADLVFHARR